MTTRINVKKETARLDALRPPEKWQTWNDSDGSVDDEFIVGVPLTYDAKMTPDPEWDEEADGSPGAFATVCGGISNRALAEFIRDAPETQRRMLAEIVDLRAQLKAVKP